MHQGSWGGAVDADRFDALLRRWTGIRSRRAMARAVAGLVLGGAAVMFRGEDASAKRCGPCRKKKKGRCKGSKPNGSPCGGVCQECRNGACLAKPDGTGCGTCQECQDGACVTSPDNAGCDGGGRCFGGTCIAKPECAESLTTCTPATAGTCCSGSCVEFDLPVVGKVNLCGKGAAGSECVQNRDCDSDSCVGYRCR
jgi:hypothetical protein